MKNVNGKANNAVSTNDELLERLTKRKNSPRIGFLVALLLYLAASVLVNLASRAGGAPIFFFGYPIPAQSFAGVFTSFANFCLIFLVVVYKKTGFIVSIVLLVLQIPMLLIGMVMQQNFASLPGLFTNFFAIAVIILISLFGSRNAKYQDRIRQQAVTDRLTGLPNRFACTELMDELVSRDERFAVALFDLNNFKSINETMGQTTGDEVLKELSSRMKAASDSGESGTRDFITHQGGDEFTIIIRNFASEESIVGTIKFYESILEEKLTVDECDYVVTGSCGYAVYPDDADDADTLLTYADMAMYEAKRLVDNRVFRFCPELLNVEHALELERKIRIALDDGSLSYELQPQFDLSHNLYGFEALARIADENGNKIAPTEFIPVAERAGLIDKIDAAVFRQSADFVGNLVKDTGANITLSVNVSVRHLMKNGFLDEVKSILSASGLSADHVEIEITESVMIDSAEKALDCITEVKKLGVKVAIDDFGTGYSSLSYLSNFPADLLKIDKSFIDNMNTSSSSKQYVAAIISIGHIMNFDVIAEGVERTEQLETLRSIDCDLIQGFLWGRPMLPEQARQLVGQSFAFQSDEIRQKVLLER